MDIPVDVTESVMRCGDCGANLIAHNDPLGERSVEALKEHFSTCTAGADRFKRIRRNKEPGYWAGSFTSLSQFDDCEKLFEFSVNDYDTSTNDAARLGTALHSYYVDKWLGLEPDLAELPIDEIDDYEWLKRRLDQFEPPADAQFEKEILLSWPVREGLMAQTRAFIDVLVIDWDRRIVFIVDWKSGRLVEEKKWISQQKMYGIHVIHGLPGEWRVVCKTVHLRSSKIVERAFTSAELHAFFAYVKAKVASVNEPGRTFEANPGPHCRNCAFRFQCDAAQKRMQRVEIELTTTKGTKAKPGSFKIVIPEVSAKEPEARKDLALAKFHLDALTKAINEALKAGGAVHLPEVGGAYGHHIVKSKRVKNVKGYVQRLLDSQADLAEAGVTINAAKAKGAIMSDPALGETTEETEYRSQRYEFRSFEPSTEDDQAD